MYSEAEMAYTQSKEIITSDQGLTVRVLFTLDNEPHILAALYMKPKSFDLKLGRLGSSDLGDLLTFIRTYKMCVITDSTSILKFLNAVRNTPDRCDGLDFHYEHNVWDETGETLVNTLQLNNLQDILSASIAPTLADGRPSKLIITVK